VANLVSALAGGSMVVAAAIPAREARAAELEVRITRLESGKGTPLSALPTDLERRIRDGVKDLGAAAAANGPEGAAKGRTLLRYTRGGDLTTEAVERDGKRVPVAIGRAPG
jgi:hypothetical protein